MGARIALPGGGGPVAARRAARPVAGTGAAPVRLPGRRAGRPAGRAARGGRGGGPQGRRRRAHAAAALGGRAVPGPSLPYLAALARFADGLAARGRVLPVLITEDGRYTARWRPV